MHIRPIQPHDNPAVAKLIRTVMTECGASGPGFAITDAEVDTMWETYNDPKSKYYVIDDGGEILGGGGFAPLLGAQDALCELRKMYFYSSARGRGMGHQMLDTIIAAATSAGYQGCYLETLRSMESAQALYLKHGFKPLDAPLGKTGHFSCDRWFLLRFST